MDYKIEKKFKDWDQNDGDKNYCFFLVGNHEYNKKIENFCDQNDFKGENSL